MDELTAITQQVALEELRDNMQYRVARTRNELEGSFSLVYKDYLKRGYINGSFSKLELSIYNALPETVTFVAMLDKEMYCTATLVIDSPLRLPMDAVYHQELNQLRNWDKKLCEIHMLACDDDLFKEGLSVKLNSKKLFFIFHLFKVIFDYVTEKLRMDGICITIDPKHKLIYDFLLFKDLGALKTNNGASVMGKYLDLHTIEEELKGRGREILSKMFLQRKTNSDNFAHKFDFDLNTLQYFFVEKTDIFRTASIQQLDYIKQCYPAYNFIKILMR